MRARLEHTISVVLRKTTDCLLPPIAGSDAGVPLIIGVVGHRDIREHDRARLQDEVQGWLTKYRTAFPTTPFILLSALAEGADRLVAEETLKLASTQLAAIIPFNIDDYQSDFSSQASRDEFRSLVSRSAFVHYCQAGDRGPTLGEARDAAYRSAGYFVAESCHILIALWDGKDNGKTGGTADIVRKKLQGGLKRDASLGLEAALTRAEAGRVLHIVTPRVSNTLPNHAFTTRLLGPSETGEFKLLPLDREKLDSDQVAALTEQFNRSAVRRKLDWRVTSRAEVTKAEPEMREALSLAAQMTLGAHALADRCANSLKAYYERLAALNIALGIAAMFLFQIKIIFEKYPISNLSLGIWLLITAIIWTAFIAIRALRIKDRLQEYRALAEGLRVSAYWQLLEIKPKVADVFLTGQQGPLDWIRRTIRTAALVDELERSKQNRSASILDFGRRSQFVHRHWIKGQCAYFFGTSNVVGKAKSGAIVRNEASKNRVRRYTRAVVGFMIASFFLFLIAHRIGGDAALIINDIAKLIISTTPAACLAIEIYLDLMAYEGTANRMHSLGNSMRRADLYLDQVRHEAAATLPVYEQIGREALNETNDWLVLHSSRELRPL